VPERDLQNMGVFAWTAGSAWEDHDNSIGKGFVHAGEQTPLAPYIRALQYREQCLSGMRGRRVPAVI